MIRHHSYFSCIIYFFTVNLALEILVLSTSLVAISDWAFYYCYRMTNVLIPT